MDDPDIIHDDGFNLNRKPETYNEHEEDNGIQEEATSKQYNWLSNFKGNSKNHYIIMFAGECVYETDTLKKHERFTASSNAIDFSKNNIAKGISKYMAYDGIIEDGCQKDSKGCFGYPTGCIHYANCDILARYEKSREHRGGDNEIYVELKVRYISYTKNHILNPITFANE